MQTRPIKRNLYQPTLDGIGWIWHDLPLCRQYAGQWVVAIPGQVIAAGYDLDLVRQEATKALGLSAEDSNSILVYAINDPDFDPHYS
jgi:ABC-type hemin transport system ATPase subunit